MILRSTEYTLGRACAVLTKPCSLFVANNFLTASCAQGLAIAYLSVALTMGGIAADPHRWFYPHHFKRERNIKNISFFSYAAAIGITMAVGLVVAFVLTIGFKGSASLAVATSIYFVSEKIGDELLRLCLFEQDLRLWGRTNICRSALHLAGFCLVGIFMRASLPAWLAVGVFGAANFAVFLPQLPAGVWLALRARRRTLCWLIGRAAGLLARNRILWVLAILSGGLAYLDRCLAIVLDRSVFPLFMLVGSCMSLTQMSVDFFFVSQNRRAFLEHRISVSSILARWQFWGYLSAGLLAGIFATTVALASSRKGAAFPIQYVVVVAGLQIGLAMISPFREIIYWHADLRSLLKIDSLFYVQFGSVTLMAYWLHARAGTYFALLLGCVAVRLTLYVIRARHDGVAATEGAGVAAVSAHCDAISEKAATIAL